jgi:hypothetical protein
MGGPEAAACGFRPPQLGPVNTTAVSAARIRPTRTPAGSPPKALDIAGQEASGNTRELDSFGWRQKNKVYAHQIQHPVLNNTWDFRHSDCPCSAGLHLLIGFQWSHCRPMAVSAEPLFINHLIDISQHLFYNRQRAVGDHHETEPIEIQQSPAHQ